MKTAIHQHPFPVIKSLDDVLKHIKNHPEITVTSNRHDPAYKVACYNLTTPDLFKIDEDNPIGGLVRRECRGMLFDATTGEIISRPFHKFFNFGENEEVLPAKIDLDLPHRIEPKLDGSMIQCFLHPISKTLLFGTKRGETDISFQAERFARETLPGDFFVILRQMIEAGFTPIFEWTSPENQIVLKYDSPQLTLLAVRDRIDGTYVRDINALGLGGVEYNGFSINEPIEKTENKEISSLVSEIRQMKNCEGFVVVFPDNGQRIKIKTTEYTTIHKVKDEFNQNRHIILSVIHNTYDDLIALLSEDLKKSVTDRLAVFLEDIDKKIFEIEDHVHKICFLFGEKGDHLNLDLKRITLEYIDIKIHQKETRTILYSVLKTKGKTVYNEIWDLTKKRAEQSMTVFDDFWVHYLRDGNPLDLSSNQANNEE